MCVAGARWVQRRLLDEIPDHHVEVYAIWYDMVRSDSKEKWPSKLLTDARVTHYWDADRLVGVWYGENVTAKSKGHVEWDAYFLYGEESSWGEGGPSHMISWGRTIVETREQLQDDLLTMLETSD